MRTPSKTINRNLSSLVILSGLSVAAGGIGTINVTTALSTALSTAGDGGKPVTLTESINNKTSGVMVDNGSWNNRLMVTESGSGDSVIDVVTNSIIYGRLTLANSIYTLDLKSFDSSTTSEVAATLPQGGYSVGIPYLFKFEDLPADSGVSVSSFDVSDNSNGAGGATVSEPLTVTALNTLSQTTYATSDQNKMIVWVGGHAEHFEVNGAWSVTGAVITWNEANADYPLEVGDKVRATYPR